MFSLFKALFGTSKEKSLFNYYEKWKEEFVCEYKNHKFTCEMTMGVIHIYFPTEEVWNRDAPNWAQGIYPEAQKAMVEWAEKNKTPYTIESNAWINFEN